VRECKRNQEVLREFVTLGDTGFADVLSTLLARKTFAQLANTGRFCLFYGFGFRVGFVIYFRV
jgi:hypothetical protein